MKSTVYTALVLAILIPVDAQTAVDPRIAELTIEFSKKALRKLGDEVPIRVDSMWKAGVKGGDIAVYLKNVSSDYIMISKGPSSWTADYLYDGAWKRDEALSVSLADVEDLDHLVLRPFREQGLARLGRRIFEVPSSHEGASKGHYHIHMGGYFPSIRDYIGFTVEVKVSHQITKAESGPRD